MIIRNFRVSIQDTLKEMIHESLTGRKRLFELSTVTFEEFINHRTDYRFEEKLRFKAASLHYWRTKDKAEVDFVIEAGRKLIPLEVKYKHLKQGKVPKPLRSFIDRYQPDQAFVINLDLRKTININKTTLFFLPFQDLLRRTAVL